MIKIKLLCIMLAMGMLFTACGNKNNGNSALGNAASDAGNGISTGSLTWKTACPTACPIWKTA